MYSTLFPAPAQPTQKKNQKVASAVTVPVHLDLHACVRKQTIYTNMLAAAFAALDSSTSCVKHRRTEGGTLSSDSALPTKTTNPPPITDRGNGRPLSCRHRRAPDDPVGAAIAAAVASISSRQADSDSTKRSSACSLLGSCLAPGAAFCFVGVAVAIALVVKADCVVFDTRIS